MICSRMPTSSAFKLQSGAGAGAGVGVERRVGIGVAPTKIRLSGLGGPRN